MELSGKVAIVTGAGIGLGQAIARKLAAEGALVALWDMDLGSAEKLATQLDPSGRKAAAFKVNVTEAAEVQAAADGTVAKFGRVDILVNNAGITRHKRLEEMTLELFEQVIKVNLTGTFLCCKAVAPVMRAQKYGKIVNIASLAARTGRPGVGVNYAASKGGVVGVDEMPGQGARAGQHLRERHLSGTHPDGPDPAVSTRGVRCVECGSGGYQGRTARGCRRRRGLPGFPEVRLDYRSYPGCKRWNIYRLRNE